MNRVFVDLDGVVVDFDEYKKGWNLTGDEVKKMQGAYLGMKPIPGAIDAVRSLIGMGFEVWISTKPPTGIAHAYADKAAWVFQYLPELKRRIVMTHDKGLLGGPGDYLLDDRPHKANCDQFVGTLLPFVNGFHWPQALDFFRIVRHGKPSPEPVDVHHWIWGQAEHRESPAPVCSKCKRAMPASAMDDHEKKCWREHAAGQEEA